MEGSRNHRILFICQNNCSLSFYLELTDRESITFTIKNIIQKAKQIKEYENYQLSWKMNSFSDYFKQSVEHLDSLFITSQFRTLPIYFHEQIIYKFNKEVLHKKEKEAALTYQGYLMKVQILYQNQKFEINLPQKTNLIDFFEPFIIQSSQNRTNEVRGYHQVTVEVTNPQNGAGIDFIDFEKDDKKQVSFSKTAPKWRIAVEGTNIEGICKTKECEAFNKQVICPIGFGNLDLIHEESRIICPICKEEITPLTSGFTNCRYVWSGRKKVDKKEVASISKLDLKAPKNQYTYYNPLKEDGSSNNVKWTVLNLQSYKNKEDQNCCVCLSEIANNQFQQCKGPFNHFVHQHCCDGMKSITEGCPFCAALKT